MRPPYAFEPEMSALITELGDVVERSLGLSGGVLARVLHHRKDVGGVPTYEISIAYGDDGSLVRRMRKAFPPRWAGKGLRVTIGPFGSLDLVDATADDIRAALARYRAAYPL